MNELVKAVAGTFAGSVGRLAIVLQRRDMPSEKFFEAALTSRGVPTFATTDYDEAMFWLLSRLSSGW